MRSTLPGSTPCFECFLFVESFSDKDVAVIVIVMQLHQGLGTFPNSHQQSSFNVHIFNIVLLRIGFSFSLLDWDTELCAAAL